MLKELPWAICPSCEDSGYLEGDGCLRCGYFTIEDKPSSITGQGTIMQVSGGSPKNRNTPGNTVDISSNPIGFYRFSHGYSFYEIDHILRLELGESFTMKTYVSITECYQIDTWIKMST